MAVETVFAPIRHGAPFVSRDATSLIPVCCLCGLIRDVPRSSRDCERWVTRRTYRNTYGVHLADCVLTHTYCPACLTQVMAQVREDNRAARTGIQLVIQRRAIGLHDEVGRAPRSPDEAAVPNH